MLQILDAFQVGNCLCDVDGRLMFADKPYAEMHGFSVLRPGQIDVRDITHAEDLEMVSTIMRRVAETAVPIVYRKRSKRRNGEVFWVENRLSALGSGTSKVFLLATHSVVAEHPQAPGPILEATFPPKALAGYIAGMANQLGTLASSSSLVLTAELLNAVADVAAQEGGSGSAGELRLN
ncbi:MAG: PAS domain S-box protein [Caulobacteraceae bacterium]